MQNEAALLDEHAKVLSNLAHELSSFASTISFLSHGYYDRSNGLSRAARRLMAGGPVMDFDTDSDTDSHILEARIKHQVALATETTDARDFFGRILHKLTTQLAGMSLEVRVEESKSLKRKRSMFEKKKCQLGCDCFPITQREVEGEDVQHALKRYRPTTDSPVSTSSQSVSGVGNRSDGSEDLPTLDHGWKTFSESWRDEDESDDWPVDKASDKSFESEDSEIYSSDLPSYEEAMHSPGRKEEECDTFEGFLRDPYGLATKTAELGGSSVPQSFVLEAAERAANAKLASGSLVNCAAAFV